MPKHVGAELQLEAVGSFEASRGRHDACVIDEKVERLA